MLTTLVSCILGPTSYGLVVLQQAPSSPDRGHDSIQTWFSPMRATEDLVGSVFATRAARDAISLVDEAKTTKYSAPGLWWGDHADVEGGEEERRQGDAANSQDTGQPLLEDLDEAWHNLLYNTSATDAAAGSSVTPGDHLPTRTSGLLPAVPVPTSAPLSIPKVLETRLLGPQVGITSAAAITTPESPRRQGINDFQDTSPSSSSPASVTASGPPPAARGTAATFSPGDALADVLEARKRQLAEHLRYNQAPSYRPAVSGSGQMTQLVPFEAEPVPEPVASPETLRQTRGFTAGADEHAGETLDTRETVPQIDAPTPFDQTVDATTSSLQRLLQRMQRLEERVARPQPMLEKATPSGVPNTTATSGVSRTVIPDGVAHTAFPTSSATTPQHVNLSIRKDVLTQHSAGFDGDATASEESFGVRRHLLTRAPAPNKMYSHAMAYLEVDSGSASDVPTALDQLRGSVYRGHPSVQR